MNKSNTTGATCGAGISFPWRVLGVLSGIRVGRSLAFFVTTGSNSGAGTNYPTVVPEFTLVFYAPATKSQGGGGGYLLQFWSYSFNIL